MADKQKQKNINDYRDGREYTLVQYLKEDDHDESLDGLNSKHINPREILVLPEDEARNQWTLLAIEPEETLGEWQLARSCDVKIFRDTRQAVKIYVSEEQSLIIRQVCRYILVGSKPRIVLPVSWGSLSDLCNVKRSFLHIAVDYHHLVVDRVGRAHCVCRASHFDPSPQTKEGHWLPVKITETQDYLNFPDECSFYDDYYAMSKATRTSKYPNTSDVWVTEETDEAQPNAASAGEIQYELRSVARQITVQKTTREVGITTRDEALLPNTNSTKRAAVETSVPDDIQLMQVKDIRRKLNASLTNLANESQEPVKKAPPRAPFTKRQRIE